MTITITCPVCCGEGVDSFDTPCRECEGCGEITPRSNWQALSAKADIEQQQPREAR